jgi:hypothetical protein
MRHTPVLLLLVLAACGGGLGDNAPIACPTPGLLGEGANLTRYRPGPVRDLTSLDFDARLTGLSGDCRPGRRNEFVAMRLQVGFAIDRGAAAAGRSADLPWFVAVIGPDGDVLSRQAFVERVAFNRNETRLAGTSESITLNLPVDDRRRAQDYRILVSFQLTEAELDLNRRRGPR